MSKQDFNDDSIASLTHRSVQYVRSHPAIAGLRVRIKKDDGRGNLKGKVWEMRESGGKRIPRQIGVFPEMSVESAEAHVRKRKEVVGTLAKFDSYNIKAALNKDMTMGELVQHYWSLIGSTKFKQWRDAESHVRRFFLDYPVHAGATPWRSRKFRDLARPELITHFRHLDTIKKPRSGKLYTSCARILSQWLSRIFTWAVDDMQLLPASPVPPGSVRGLRKSKPRKRIHSAEELQRVFELAELETPIDRLAIRISVMTAMRQRMISASLWNQIKRDRWVIRKDKMGHDMLAIPMTAMLRGDLDALQIITGRFPHLFPHDERPELESRTQNWLTQMVRNFVAKHELEHFTHHDFRRSLRTVTAEMGLSFEAGELCIGHVGGRDDAKVYLLAKYWAEVRAGFIAYHTYLEQCMLGNGAAFMDRLQNWRTDTVLATMLPPEFRPDPSAPIPVARPKRTTVVLPGNVVNLAGRRLKVTP